MKKAKWDELILDAVAALSDSQGDSVSVVELTDYVLKSCVIWPKRSTVTRHVYRLVDEGRLGYEPAVYIPGGR